MVKPDSKEARAQNLVGFRRMVMELTETQASSVLDDAYALAAPPLKAGSRYFTVACACGKRAPFVEDYSDGRLGNPFMGKGSVNVPCASCGQIASSAAREIRSETWQAN